MLYSNPDRRTTASREAANMTSEAPDRLLGRVRKLLAKAEDEGVTPQESQALTAKAAELMAKYGIDRALLAATRPETDAPASRLVELDNPWNRVKAHLLCGLGAAMRCQCILLTAGGRLRVHMFGYASDLERADVLFTSVLIQMSHGLAVTPVPAGASPRAWRRSWLLGFGSAVIGRVREAEAAAAGAGDPPGESGRAALVLADRSVVIRAAVAREYPRTRPARVTYSGSGYGDGYAKGQRADLGTGRVTRPASRPLTRSGG
jgi:hypothetical protein